MDEKVDRADTLGGLVLCKHLRCIAESPMYHVWLLDGTTLPQEIIPGPAMMLGLSTHQAAPTCVIRYDTALVIRFCPVCGQGIIYRNV